MQRLPEKGAAGMLFILQDVCAPVAVSKYKVPDIPCFAVGSHLAVCAVELLDPLKGSCNHPHTRRIIPAEALEMCGATEARHGGPVPQTHTFSVFIQLQRQDASL